jgi:hypothetical protein
MWTHRAVRIGGIAVGVLVLGLVLGSRVFAPIAPPAPPGIDDLVGTWDATYRWLEYRLDSPGEKNRWREQATCTITQTGPTTVNMHFEGDDGSYDETAAYSAGILVIGAADDDVLATSSITGYMLVRGRPGRLTAKGQLISYYRVYWVDIGNLSLRHRQP